MLAAIVAGWVASSAVVWWLFQKRYIDIIDASDGGRGIWVLLGPLTLATFAVMFIAEPLGRLVSFLGKRPDSDA